jgi:hypothetical protein
MPLFVSKRELARLERELKAARQRADDAERRLASERQSKDWVILQLTSRFVTKQGLYGLDHEPPAPPPPDPRGFTRQPTAEDEARREHYIKCYLEVGRSEEDAVAIWEAEMRGEHVVYPYEQESQSEQ